MYLKGINKLLGKYTIIIINSYCKYEVQLKRYIYTYMKMYTYIFSCI